MSVWDTVGGSSPPTWHFVLVNPDHSPRSILQQIGNMVLFVSKRHVVKIQDPLVDSRECRWFPNGSRKTWSPVNKNRCVWKVPTCKFRISCCTYLYIHTDTILHLLLLVLRSSKISISSCDVHPLFKKIGFVEFGGPPAENLFFARSVQDWSCFGISGAEELTHFMPKIT